MGQESLQCWQSWQKDLLSKDLLGTVDHAANRLLSSCSCQQAAQAGECTEMKPIELRLDDFRAALHLPMLSGGCMQQLDITHALA